jgi:small subunit ribosomal protein S4
MVKFTGPRLKIIRRLGLLPGLTPKFRKLRKRSPGQHGKLYFSKAKRPSLAGDYKERLLEKQKVRYNYGVTESQLISYYKKAKKQKEATGNVLLNFLESRLDCIVYRLGFAPTIPAARQLVNHKHILVNDKVVNIPSFLCKKGDSITSKNTEKSHQLILSTLKKVEENRRAVEKRVKESRMKKSEYDNIKSLLPGHLELSANTFTGKVIKSIKRINHMKTFKDLKVVEYYSR